MDHVALFVVGLALLAVGAPLLVLGAARLDRATGRGPFAVGLVAVGFGPCVAGLAFDLAMVLRKPPAAPLAVGHIVGANVASVGLVLGLAALVRPLVARGKLFQTALPVALAATALFWFLAREGRAAEFGRVQAGVLLAAGVGAVVLLVRAARAEPDDVKAEFAGAVPARMPVWVAGALALAGVAALAGGAVLCASEVRGAAEHLNVTRRVLVLGDTLCAFATALPAAGAAALTARRGRGDLALALAVGPVIFNLLFAAGAVAMVQPLVIDEPLILQVVPVMALFALLLVPVYANGLTVPRWEGALLLVAYAGFISWQVWKALR